MEKRKFVILSSPRSGSTIFRLWLNSHKTIRCHDEVLLKRLDAKDSIHSYALETIGREELSGKYDRDNLGQPDDEFSTRLLKSFLGSLFYNEEHCGAWTTPDNINDRHVIENYAQETAIGFKLMSYTLDNHFVRNWITSEPVSILHLVRENVLKQLISNIIAKKRKVWFSDKPQEQIKIRLDTEMVKSFLPNMIAHNEKIRKQFPGNPYLKVTYEDFCTRPESLQAEICEYLGSENTGMEMPGLKKLVTARIPEIVLNYDEVHDALQSTPYEKFLSM